MFFGGGNRDNVPVPAGSKPKEPPPSVRDRIRGGMQRLKGVFAVRAHVQTLRENYKQYRIRQEKLRRKEEKRLEREGPLTWQQYGENWLAWTKKKLGIKEYVNASSLMSKLDKATKKRDKLRGLVVEEDSSSSEESQDSAPTPTTYRQAKQEKAKRKKGLQERVVDLTTKKRKPKFWEADYPIFNYQQLDLTKEIWWIRMFDRIGPKTLYLLNTAYWRLGDFFYALTWNRQNKFQDRRLYILALQFCCSIQVSAAILNTLNVYFDMRNFFLLTTFANVLPFIFAFYSLMVFLPCPTMAALVCNATMTVMLLIFTFIASGTSGNIFGTFIQAMAFWPFLAAMSMLARIFVGQPDRQFHPLKHIPLMALFGAAAQYFLILANKELELTDFLVFLASIDPWMSSVLTPIMERTRLPIYFGLLKTLLFLSGIVALYWSQLPYSPITGFTYLFLSRAVYFSRSLFVKRYNMVFFEAEAVDPPAATEKDLFFFPKQKPHKYIFDDKPYPLPTLLRLDVAFQSGLCDDTYHSIGTAGTRDLYMLTDWMFGLPLMAIATVIHESGTVFYGFFPPILGPVGGTPMGVEPSEMTTPIKDDSTYHVMKCLVLVIMYHICKLFEPDMISKTLFDRGSSPNDWGVRPIVFSSPLVLLDQLFLNSSLSNSQILQAFTVFFGYNMYRKALFRKWKRNYLLLTTQELQYYQPNVFHTLHRKTMLEFLDRAPLDEYQMILLETAMSHGMNIRDPTKDLTIRPNRPDPAATAAWKMAIGMVVHLAKTQRQLRQARIENKRQDTNFCEQIFLECADKAIDFLHRLPTNEPRAIAHFKPRAHKMVFARFKKFVEWRKTEERARVEGQRMADFSRFKDELFTEAAHQPNYVMQGRVMIFGSNEFGQLGVRLQKTDIREPGYMYPLYAVDGFRIRQLCAGPRSSFFVTNRFMFSCGSNRVGELGLNPALTEVVVPRCLKTMRTNIIAQMSCNGDAGDVQTLFLTNQGKVYAAGQSSTGALSNLPEQQRRKMEEDKATTLQGPVQLDMPFLVRFVACGSRHSLFLAWDGSVHACGDNRKGQLGQPMKVKKSAKPLLVKNLESECYLLATGSDHTMVALERHGLFSWGANAYGQCGTDGAKDLFAPTRVIFHEHEIGRPHGGGSYFLSLACGEHHSLISSVTMYRTWACGSNFNQQCGIMDSETGKRQDMYRTATLIPTLAKKYPIVSLMAAGQHSVALDRDGAVYVFGDNSFGQLGFDARSRPKIAKPEMLNQLAKFAVRSISTGATHTMLLL
ncbi:unnamed protein product [Amoebophrya sp. A120]|nr:unnamed protein product [Amoebophrya sp. A120]|eukprot:GSA120T00006501001.1